MATASRRAGSPSSGRAGFDEVAAFREQDISQAHRLAGVGVAPLQGQLADKPYLIVVFGQGGSSAYAARLDVGATGRRLPVKWSRGGRRSRWACKKTDFLLAGEEARSKLDKAKQLGVKVLSEAEFERMTDTGRKN